MERQNFQKTKVPTDIELGKRLSWLLRHGAAQEGLPIQADGFVEIESILRHPKYAQNYSQAVLERLVANDNKQRFMLQRDASSGVLKIRANQGHSLKTVLPDECLERITDPKAIPMAVHGTYHRHWKSICKEGLRRMSRNHVHFATSDVCGKNSTSIGVSGFRSDCQILIYLDVPKVLGDERMRLYLSANGVVLCTGIGEAGQIPVEFFAKVIERRSGKPLECLTTLN